MDTGYWSILAKLLNMASDEFSNHGCNDFELPNTPENRALMEAAEKWNAPGAPEKLMFNQEGTTIYSQDYFLMSFFAHLAHELAGEADPD